MSRYVEIAIAAESIDNAVRALENAGFKAESFDWSINFKGKSQISIQISTKPVYQSFPSRSVAADVHGILMRVASLEDTLHGKVRISGCQPTAERKAEGPARHHAVDRVPSRSRRSTSSRRLEPVTERPSRSVSS